MNAYKKALIELMLVISKSLYDILDAKIQTTNKEDERLKEYILVNLCSIISKEEIDRFIKIEMKEFRNKYKVNKMMSEKIDEVAKEIEKILTKVLLENQYEVNKNSPKVQSRG